MEPEDIDTLLPRELVSLEEPPAEKEACIEHLLDMAVEAGRIEDREAALEALLAREEETTTGVGLGIGIPHAQTDAVTEPTVAFVRSDRGVDFDAMDDQPATLIFMLLVPEGGEEEHLNMLSTLSRALMHEETRDSLHEAESPEEVRGTLKEAVA
ncbi:fructose PTS transporter subunit IIA [Halalkalicoccus tibetensis]|uniref:PTS sugar transporter subunit IIA n=1 Tax=Halalkalicoccus tibetensis TaxID=175632 RepID=A0ABD5V6R2_9EURY